MESCIFFKESLNLFSAEEKRKDFDILGIVFLIKVAQKSGKLKITVSDQKKICNIYLDLPNEYKLKSGDFIRIRSGSFLEDSTKKIEVKGFSNILKIPLSKTTQQIENLICLSNDQYILFYYYLSQNMLNHKVITEIINDHGLDRKAISNKSIKEMLINNQFAILKGNLINVVMISLQSKCIQMVDDEEFKINGNYLNNIEIKNEFIFEINQQNSPPIIVSTLYCPAFFTSFYSFITRYMKRKPNWSKKIFQLLNRLVKESKCNMELLIFQKGDEIYIKDTILNLKPQSIY